MNTPLWQPSEQKKEKSILEDFSKFINFNSDKNFQNLWEWSVKNP